jgi:hypothetical protein
MVSPAELILLKGKIKAIILRDSEGYFDGPKESEGGVGLLLSLVPMMFLFMTVYFPSFSSFTSENG